VRSAKRLAKISAILLAMHALGVRRLLVAVAGTARGLCQPGLVWNGPDVSVAVGASENPMHRLLESLIADIQTDGDDSP
jgi:hypothetical protein